MSLDSRLRRASTALIVNQCERNPRTMSFRLNAAQHIYDSMANGNNSPF